MRTPFFVILAFSIAACGHNESSGFTLHYQQVERIDGCHIILDAAPGRGKEPFAAIRFACDVPEAAQKEKNWWGEQSPPLGFTMNLGDCLLLNQTFYCVDKISVGEASLKPTYKWATRHHEHLEIIH